MINLTPSTYASAADFDNAGVCLATMLETSVRMAVVAARDVRRKDRRVCMIEHKDEVRMRKYEGNFRARFNEEGKRSTPKVFASEALNAERPTSMSKSNAGLSAAEKTQSFSVRLSAKARLVM